MSAPQFTPGPWSFGAWGVHADGLGKRAGKIAEVSIAFKDSATRDANGFLLAAAPELYAQVEQFERVAVYEIEKLKRQNPEDDEGVRLRTLNLNLIRAALARARGQ
jgi:hypothetical protein